MKALAVFLITILLALPSFGAERSLVVQAGFGYADQTWEPNTPPIERTSVRRISAGLDWATRSWLRTGCELGYSQRGVVEIIVIDDSGTEYRSEHTRDYLDLEIPVLFRCTKANWGSVHIGAAPRFSIFLDESGGVSFFSDWSKKRVAGADFIIQVTADWFLADLRYLYPLTAGYKKPSNRLFTTANDHALFLSLGFRVSI